MKCTCCGRELTSDDRYCPVCGQNNPNYIEPPKVETVEQKYSNSTQNSNYQSNSYNQQNNYGYQHPQTIYVRSESKAIAVLALIFSILGGWLGLLFAIIGLATYKEDGNRGMCKAALTIFIIEAIVVFVIYLAIYASL